MGAGLLEKENPAAAAASESCADHPAAPTDVRAADTRIDEAILEADLRRAIDRQEFRVFFEPILSLATHRILGFEALLRWQSPRGLLSPASFLPIAEKTGLIIPIGLWVLRQACRDMRAWQQRYPQTPPLIVSVNVSAKQFEQPDLVEQIRRVLDETQLAPESLRLEITETLVVKSPDAARAMLLQLRALDVKVGIDDFGAGYSSLSYVRTFPVHTLKIDKSFVGSLEHQKENLEIVRAIITMARNLGLEVVAEGVETAGQLALLKILRCDCGQGHLFSKPVDRENAEALIATSLAEQVDHLLSRPAQAGAETKPVGYREAWQETTEEGPTPDSAFPPPESSAASIQPQSDAAPRDVQTRRPVTGWKALTFGGLLTAVALLAIAAFLIRGRGERVEPRGAGPQETATQAPAPKAAAAPQPIAPPKPDPALTRATQSSMSDNRYVLPARKNAVFYCNQILKVFPQDAQARRLKDESLRLALAQGDEMARAGRFDEAGRIYSALLSLVRGDGKAAVGAREAQAGLGAIKFVSYAVAHDHFLSSCQGKLTFNSYTISFTPVEGAKHAFSAPLDQIAAHLDGKFLKIVFGNKTFKFKSPSAADRQQGASEMNAIYQEVAQRTDAKPRQAGSPR